MQKQMKLTSSLLVPLAEFGESLEPKPMGNGNDLYLGLIRLSKKLADRRHFWSERPLQRKRAGLSNASSAARFSPKA